MKLAILAKIGNDMPVPELCALLAEQGYHGVEWRTHPEGHVRLDHVLADARATGAAARRHGLESLYLAGYCKTYEADQMEPQLAAAAEIGCPHVHVWPPANCRSLPYQELFAGARRDLERIAGMACRHGVRAVLESHYGTIAPSAGLEEGLIDWPAFLRVLHWRAYDGYLSNEDSRPVPLPARLAEDRDIVARLWRESGNGAAAAAPALARAG